MVELTHGGFWVKWNSLAPRDRRWGLFSILTAVISVLPIALQAYILPLIGGNLFAYLIIAAVLLMICSVIGCWQAHRSQDEMFKRMQNFANAQAGNWFFIIAFIWWTLSLGRWVGPPPLTVLFELGLGLWIAFWFYAVRRWA